MHLGTQPFGSLELFVSPPTLIPRPETEEWAIWLSETLKHDITQSGAPRLNVLDICTGTGCIPLLLREELGPNAVHALGVDVSPAAISLATRNAASGRPAGSNSAAFEALQLDVFSDDFVNTLRQHPIYPFDLITSNPPYISRSEYISLSRTVRAYEDPLALIGEAPLSHGDTGGLAFYHRIAALLAQYPDLLKMRGRFVLEIGARQAEDVSSILASALGPRLDFIATRKDTAGLDRVVHGRVI